MSVDTASLEKLLRHARRLRVRDLCYELSCVRGEIEKLEAKERQLAQELDRIDPPSLEGTDLGK